MFDCCSGPTVSAGEVVRFLSEALIQQYLVTNEGYCKCAMSIQSIKQCLLLKVESKKGDFSVVVAEVKLIPNPLIDGSVKHSWPCRERFVTTSPSGEMTTRSAAVSVERRCGHPSRILLTFTPLPAAAQRSETTPLGNSAH